MCGEINSASETGIDLVEIWRVGYSIAELWGFSKPVSRGSAPDNNHLILWGILGIVEYQVDRNAGHAYLRDRLRNGDWIAVGFLEPKTPKSRLEILPPIKDAKFGRNQSAIGDGVTNYVDVRIVHARALADVQKTMIDTRAAP
jgi:hypothetical protein